MDRQYFVIFSIPKILNLSHNPPEDYTSGSVLCAYLFYRFFVSFQISTFFLFSFSYHLSNNLLKASPVSVTIPQSIHLPRVTSRKTEQKWEWEKGWIARVRFALRAWRSATCRDFVPFRISKTIRHPEGAAAATRPGRVDGGLYRATSAIEGERADFRRTAVIRGAIVLSDGTATDIKARVERCSLCH